MIQTAIVVFREALEVAIVVALLLAATRGVAGRSLWTVVGLVAGAAGSAVVAVFAEAITDAFSGRGQDLFNAGVLLLTVVMVAGTIAWMRAHARTIAADAVHVGERVRTGQAPLYFLATAIGIAVLRDGSELVVFLTALNLSGQSSTVSVMVGFSAGAGAGAIVGAMIYYGVIRAALRRVFGVVTFLLAFLGAGLAAQAAGFLVSAGWLPALIDPLWDSSWLLDGDSALGQLAHALLGYVAQPSAVQVVFYVLVLAGICSIGFRAPPSPQPQPAS